METVWNVVVPVVACLRSPDGTQAYSKLAAALRAAGFEVYEDSPAPDHGWEPFEAEGGTEESDPPNGRPW